jgi:4-hydroxyacetophenone monooxygenase
MTTDTDTTVDEAFIRRAVELADLNAVKVALFQQTHDPALAALPVATNLDDAERALLIDKAVSWLSENAGPGMPAEPAEDELRTLMTMATGEEMGELEFESRRDLPAFKDFPWAAEWSGERPELPEGFKVTIIGSGFSGLAMAVQLGLLGIPYEVLDRQSEPGGTWSINRYPDIRVDTISITYEYSFEKNYPWSEYFGRGAEVRDYLEHISRKYGVYENTRFERDLVNATFDEERGIWVLELKTPEGAETIETNVLVNCLGTFANPKLPSFEGQELFEGQTIHPARWPDGLDLTGKRVAIVGNGSTGVQILSRIAEDAAQVSVFQRTPQWIAPRAKYGQSVEPEIRWLLDSFPGYWNWWRYMAIAALFGTHGFLTADEEWIAKGGHFNPMSDKLREDLIAYIKAEVGDRQDLIDHLIPDYMPFARRPVVDNGWYRALTRDNVELVCDPIARLTPTGIVTQDGTERAVEVIITATGYDVAKYLWPARYLGAGGLDVQDFWSKDGARAYLGMMIPHFPNMFMLYGPNSQPVSGGTGLPVWYVVWASYVAKCLTRMLETGASTVEVTQEAFEAINKDLDVEAAKTILMREEGAPDKNYYVNSFGRVQVSAPWYGPEYHRMCTQVSWGDIRFS